jgi:hypothetical protein
MAVFADNFPDEELMTALGDDIIYKRGSKTFAIKAIINRNVDHVGNNGYAIERRTEIEFLKSAIPLMPQRDDIIKENNMSFTIDAVISDDGVYIKVAVR